MFLLLLQKHLLFVKSNHHLLQMVFLMVSVLQRFCVKIRNLYVPMASVNARVASEISMDTVVKVSFASKSPLVIEISMS